MQLSFQSKCCSRVINLILVGITAAIITLTAILIQLNVTESTGATNYTANIDIATSAMSLDFSSIPSWSESSYLTLILVMLTLSQTFFIGLYRFHNSDTRWKTKRSMAMRMESIIWRFRTYTGPFSKTQLPLNQSADDVLEQQIQEWCDTTVASADLVSTEIMKRMEQKHVTHRQYPKNKKKGDPSMNAARIGKKILKKRVVNALRNAKNNDDADCDLPLKKQYSFVHQAEHEEVDTRPCCRCCTFDDTDEWSNSVSAEDIDEWDSAIVEKNSVFYTDDDFSPMSAAGYLKHRILKKLRFYQNRIPKYYYLLNAFTYIVAFLTLAASAFAVFNVPPSSQMWVAIVTACLNAFVIFDKYFDAGTKLKRYTNTVKDLQILFDYWQGLSILQQNKLSNIEMLVDKGESIILDVSFCILWLYSEYVGMLELCPLQYHHS